jgi:methionyl-tRNA formyltransferase
MRILVCAQRDLVVCVVLNHLLPALGDHTVVVALNRPPSQGDATPKDPLSRQRWFERDVTDHLVFPLLDRLPDPAGELLTFGHLARKFQVGFHHVEHINTGDGYGLLREFQPDLILSVRFDLIFKDEVLGIPPLGVVNIHPGALPEHAGLAAPMHTLVSGESSLTSTLHEVDQGIDSGAVIASASLPFDRGHSLFWHLPQLYERGIDLFLEVLPTLARGDRPPAAPQDRTRRRYHGRPRVEEMHAFENLGFRFLLETDFEDVVRRFGATWSAGQADGLLRSGSTSSRVPR